MIRNGNFDNICVTFWFKSGQNCYLKVCHLNKKIDQTCDVLKLFDSLCFKRSQSLLFLVVPKSDETLKPQDFQT